MQITTREFLLIERDQIATVHRDLGETFFFILRAVAPKNFIRLAHGGNVFDPFLNMSICGYRTCRGAHELTCFSFLDLARLKWIGVYGNQQSD